MAQEIIKPLTVKGQNPIKYEFLGRLSAADLNSSLSEEVVMTANGNTSLYNLFNEKVNGQQAAKPFNADLGAHNAVDFYRLTYNTKIPETKSSYQVSGLLAIPALQQKDRQRTSAKIPLLSWQHGTILDPKDAPSELIRNGSIMRQFYGAPWSSETLFNVVRFAGNGYALAAADYIGNGISDATQAYAVKDATIQTTKDMITGATMVIKSLRGTTRDPISKLALNGWSQGGINTQWLGTALQNDGIMVNKQSQSAAPTDIEKTASYWFNDYPGDPNWLTCCVPLLLGSYEKYYGLKGLMQAAVKSDYIDIANKIYNKQIDWSKVAPAPEGQGLLGLPAKPIDMINQSFIDNFNAGKGDFYARVKANSALEEKYNHPTRFYGGSADNVVPEEISVNLPVNFQQGLGSDLSSGLDMGPAATHRGTFLSSLFGSTVSPGSDILTWFNSH